MNEQPSALSLAAARETGRWYPLRDHPVQRALVTDNVRFKVVPAGRRSGKTERLKRFVVREALRAPMPYFLAAPTHAQAKRIFWEDVKLLGFAKSMPGVRVSETDLRIVYPNGGSISIIGLDEPRRMEGVLWGGGGIDEIADIKDDAWEVNISPALDTMDPRRPGYKAWCWLIGVPEGFNHFHKRAEYARTGQDPDWRLYHWLSADILPPEVIEAARRRMSAQQFRQEYEASFETFLGRIYADYGPKNVTSELIRPDEQLWWCHDFNFTPLSSAVCVRRGDSMFALGEVVLESAIARQSAIEFVNRYKGHGNKSVIVYGDPAGRAGEKHGHASDYTEMESVLRSHGWTVQRRVKAAAPSIRDRQNAVRAKVANAAGASTFFVNPQQAPTLHQGMLTVQFKKGSTFQEEQSREQHITTAVGYCMEFEWPVRHEEAPIALNIVPTKSAFSSRPRA